MARAMRYPLLQECKEIVGAGYVDACLIEKRLEINLCRHFRWLPHEADGRLRTPQGDESV
jgi:hypothetical protein